MKLNNIYKYKVRNDDEEKDIEYLDKKSITIRQYLDKQLYKKIERLNVVFIFILIQNIKIYI